MGLFNPCGEHVSKDSWYFHDLAEQRLEVGDGTFVEDFVYVFFVEAQFDRCGRSASLEEKLRNLFRALPCVVLTLSRRTWCYFLVSVVLQLRTFGRLGCLPLLGIWTSNFLFLSVVSLTRLRCCGRVELLLLSLLERFCERRPIRLAPLRVERVFF
jgi:hypothetical protein